MSVTVRPFQPGDVAQLDLQPAQLCELTEAARLPEYGAQLWRAGPAFTAEEGGRLLACAGVMEVQPHHATAWAFLAGGLGASLVPVTRAVLRFLDACGYQRVDMVVRCNFRAGRKWARMLGFTCEGRMRRAGPHGEDYILYARIAEDAAGQPAPRDPGDIL
jgi:hypothetical protein